MNMRSILALADLIRSVQKTGARFSDCQIDLKYASEGSVLTVAVNFGRLTAKISFSEWDDD